MKKLIFIAGLMLFLGMAVMAQAATVTYTGNYAVVTGWSGTWDQANLDLAERLGKSWTLAVITGASEQGFVAASIAGQGNEFWLGGLQNPLDTQDANKNWSWVTGEAWNYTNWSGGEPNDAYGPGSEQYLAIWANGGWNDEGNTSFITGYVAEKASTSAPEPSTILTLISGLLGLLGFRKKFAK